MEHIILLLLWFAVFFFLFDVNSILFKEHGIFFGFNFIKKKSKKAKDFSVQTQNSLQFQ